VYRGSGSNKLSTNVYEKNIKIGVINVIGSLYEAIVDTIVVKKDRYEEVVVKELSELVSGMGNTSLKENEPFIHLHVVLGLKGLTYIRWSSN